MRWLEAVAAATRRGVGRAVHRSGGATRSDIRQLRSELQALRGDSDARLAQLAGQIDEIDSRADARAITSATVAGRIDALVPRVDQLAARSQWFERSSGDVATRLAGVESLVAIDAVTRFVRYARLRTDPLVSVVLPTYERPDRLRRAIQSVLWQRYPRWELIVVDDGGVPDSRAIVDEVNDPRIRWTRIDHRGVSAARNAALASAAGELIAYLDDDNLMDPEWLCAVVWALEQRPDVDVLYGAFIIDDVSRVDGKWSASGHLPRTFLRAWNRDGIRHGNLTDIGAIAHRAGLPEARFDETLREAADWDLLLRLTADRDPLVLPVIAHYYMTDAPHRLTSGPTHDADLASVKARATVPAR